MDNWNDSLAALAGNIKKMHRKLRREGVVRMSPRNLRAIVDLRGVSVPPAAFERLFEEALKKAKAPAGFFADAVD